MFDQLYEQLRELAASYLRRERADHTLQPTALVHEAWLKFTSVDSFDRDDDQSRRQFLSYAARAMRQILVDHARRKGAQKRDAGFKVTLHDAVDEGFVDDAAMIDIDAALHHLATELPRAAKIAELRLFAGLSIEEVAEVVEVSPATVKIDWRLARALLTQRIQEADRS